MGKATMCIYCGHTIPHPNDPDEINKQLPEIHKRMVEHDQTCSKNPLVKRIKELEELTHNFATGKDDGQSKTIVMSIPEKKLKDLQDAVRKYSTEKDLLDMVGPSDQELSAAKSRIKSMDAIWDKYNSFEDMPIHVKDQYERISKVQQEFESRYY